MSGKPRLPNVTVCAADCLHPDLAARAIEKCRALVEFGDAVLCSDKRVDGGFRWQEIAPLKSTADYSRFCLRDMAEHIATPFVLVVQWDGYIADPAQWSPSFLKFDYVGAPWKDGMVGNGGFSLRSRRLLDAAKDVPLVPGYAEDRLICHIFRETLEKKHKIRFAPAKQAEFFSYEDVVPKHPTFGFHGLYNLVNHEPDEVVRELAQALTPAERASWQYFHMTFDCMDGRRDALGLALYRLSRREMSAERIKALASKGSISAAAIGAGVDRLEAMIAAEPAAKPLS